MHHPATLPFVLAGLPVFLVSQEPQMKGLIHLADA